jgi:hypothetical protein
VFHRIVGVCAPPFPCDFLEYVYLHGACHAAQRRAQPRRANDARYVARRTPGVG